MNEALGQGVEAVRAVLSTTLRGHAADAQFVERRMEPQKEAGVVATRCFGFNSDSKRWNAIGKVSRSFPGFMREEKAKLPPLSPRPARANPCNPSADTAALRASPLGVTIP